MKTFLTAIVVLSLVVAKIALNATLPALAIAAIYCAVVGALTLPAFAAAFVKALAILGTLIAALIIIGATPQR